MSNTSTDTLGFGPVEEFVDVAIVDRTTLEILEKQLKRPEPMPDAVNQRQELSPNNGVLGQKQEREKGGRSDHA